MKELRVTRNTTFEMMYNSMVMAATLIPSDVRNRLLQYLEKEKSEIARLHLRMILENCEIGEKKGRIPCPDTGYPLYYVRSHMHDGAGKCRTLHRRYRHKRKQPLSPS